MTKSQRRQHKIGNQIRKIQILHTGWGPHLGGVIQDGKHTATQKSVWERIKHHFGVEPKPEPVVIDTKKPSPFFAGLKNLFRRKENPA